MWVLQPNARWLTGRDSRRRRTSVKMDHRKELRQGRLLPRVRIVPVGQVPLAVAKYEVPLREEALRAVHADQTIRTRMVVFQCNWCCERFATFHPAYWPPWEVWSEMELLRRGSDGVALCNIEVESWDELPPFEEDPEAGGVAQVYRGTCRGCAVDMHRQRQTPPEGMSAEVVRVIPKRSAYNGMDPIFSFPREELQSLFDQASLVEEMLVALEHMQVHMVTVKGRGAGLVLYKKNVISFVQDTPGFAQRHSLLREFRVGDRVNSTRGPGRDVNRARVVWTPSAPYTGQSTDASGFVVFPGTVMEKLAGGELLVRYDGGGEGVELEEHLVARVRMPWSPKDLKGQLVIMLRRSLGRGRGYLEGLEVRWGLVARILRALCRFGEWGPEGRRGPMHKYYDQGLFDLPAGRGGSVEEDERLLREWYGEDLARPSDEGPEGLRRVGMDVREVGEVRASGDEVSAIAAEIVDGQVFARWLGLAPLAIGAQLGAWWASQEVSPAGSVEGIRGSDSETPADFLAKIGSVLRDSGGLVDGEVTVGGLASWLLEHAGFRGELDSGSFGDEEEFTRTLSHELHVVAEHYGGGGGTFSSACLEAAEGGVDEERRAQNTAENVLYGWPRISEEPTPFRLAGRFVKAFPLKFPLGEGGVFDIRPREVTPQEWAALGPVLGRAVRQG